MKIFQAIVATVLLLPSAMMFGGARDHVSSEEGVPPFVVEPISTNVAALLLVHPVATLRVEPAVLKVVRAAEVRMLPTTDSLPAMRDMPVIGAVSRRMGDRFNTSESSRIDAFAVCYHLSDRVGFQVIPGNPAPPRMGATLLQNNAGVTVGMTLRLQRRR